VRYGEILELARAKLERLRPNRFRRLMLSTVTKPRRLALAQRLPMPKFVARRIAEDGSDQLSMPKSALGYEWPAFTTVADVRGEVALLEGCAMRQMFPGVNQATKRLIRRAGFDVAPLDLGCCGALHAHSGHLEEATEMAERVRQLAGDRPILVNSAGCGSWLKEVGLNVRDLTEFLMSNPIQDTPGLSNVVVTYHDACHLAHGQRITKEPRDLIRNLPGIQLVELPEADRCCGSAGIYSALQPKMAGRLLKRKLDNIRATDAEIVILANPGCHAWIGQGDPNRRPKVLHLAELLEASYCGIDPRSL